MSLQQESAGASTETPQPDVGHAEEARTETRQYRTLDVAVVAGVVAGALFGGMLPSAVFMPTFAELYAQSTVIGGWLVHFLHSVCFALLYAVVVDYVPRLTPLAAIPSRGSLVGACYGVLVWLVAVVVVFPFWHGMVTVHSLPMPYLQELLLLGHVVYGTTLGALYPVLAGVNDR